MKKFPRSLYGPNQDGLGDPQQATPLDRQTASTARLSDENGRRNSRSPVMAALQRAADQALGRGQR